MAGFGIAGKLAGTQRERMRAGRTRSRVAPARRVAARADAVDSSFSHARKLGAEAWHNRAVLKVYPKPEAWMRKRLTEMVSCAG